MITATCLFTSIDLASYAATVVCLVTSWGRFDDSGRFAALPWADRTVNASAGPSNVSLVLVLGGTRVERNHGDTEATIEVKLSLGGGREDQVDVFEYPGVVLPFALSFGAWWVNKTSNEPLADSDEPPVVVQLGFNNLPLYLVFGTKCVYSMYESGFRWYTMKGYIQLSPAAQNGVSSLNACTWCLAALTCLMSIVWCMLAKPREHMPFDLLCFSGALLFAIPGMRGLLPAAPSAGTRYDILNVYGQQWLITISIMLKMLSAVVMDEWRRRREVLKQQQQPQSQQAQPQQQPVESVLSNWVHGKL